MQNGLGTRFFGSQRNDPTDDADLFWSVFDSSTDNFCHYRSKNDIGGIRRKDRMVLYRGKYSIWNPIVTGADLR